MSSVVMLKSTQNYKLTQAIPSFRQLVVIGTDRPNSIGSFAKEEEKKEEDQEEHVDLWGMMSDMMSEKSSMHRPEPPSP